MTSNFNYALQVVKDNYKRKKEGGHNSLPFSLRKYNRVIPGVQRKNMTIVSAASGLGKSKFAKLFYVIEPFEFAKKHPTVHLDIFYFALEESRINFIHSVMVYKLFKDYGLIIPIKKLKSILDEETIDDDIISKLEAMETWFIEFENTVRIIDDVRHPTGIYKKVEDFIETVGDWETRIDLIRTPNGVKSINRKVKFRYHYPQHYVITIVDHIGLLTPERGLTLHQTMSRMSSDYGIRLRDKFECTIIFVQQQAAESESKQFTFKGSLVETKLEPTLQTLAGNKEIARDSDEIIALFAPDRYDIANHRGYDIIQFQDHYRSLQVLKSRDGEANIRIGLFFDGRVNIFEELPKSKEITEEDYEYYANRTGVSIRPQRSGVINFD